MCTVFIIFAALGSLVTNTRVKITGHFCVLLEHGTEYVWHTVTTASKETALSFFSEEDTLLCHEKVQK
jgi:hypothetical protein